MKSISGSTETREPGQNEAANEKTEGSWLKRTTLMSCDKPSHDLIAKDCLLPTEPLKGVTDAKIVTVGPDLVRVLICSLMVEFGII